MGSPAPPTLVDLAIQSLLRDEATAVRALAELPDNVFPHLLTVAFRGEYRRVLRGIVQAWPFRQLRLAPLLAGPGPWLGSLWAVLHGLDARPARSVRTRKSKLKVVDFRQDSELIQFHECSEDATEFVLPFATWVEPEVTVHGTKPRQRRCLKKGTWQAWESVDIYINLSLGSVRMQELSYCVLRKVQKSCRPLHLFCRKLYIENMSVNRTVEILNLLPLEFIQELEVCDRWGLLSGRNVFARQVEQMKNLCHLKLSSVLGPWPSGNGSSSHALISFLSHLTKLEHLQMLHLSSDHISGHLHQLLSYLPSSLETLELPFCALLDTDIHCLSKSPQAAYLKKLDLSQNNLSYVLPGVLEALLREVSGTLEQLVLSHCKVTDVYLMAFLPTLSCCFHLQSLSLSNNLISSSGLINLMQFMAGLPELKHVVCPVPLECYSYLPGSQLCYIKPQFIKVEAMFRKKLQALRQEHVKWTFTLR
ncbi:melanoma antigen preferentially expressed in tumors-like [Tamandua tetradactyla]|uniref:melanoma antigen preferentially expressed in tumors-like n=1 Tax=Tamandua tetradactyla TaxID=48850 RepID=UPI0040542B41